MFHAIKHSRTVILAVTVIFAGILLLSSHAGAAPKIALDANGGTGKPYLNKNLAPNDNLLWKLERHGKNYVRIIPKVKNVALDANGGTGTPYLNENLDPNDNLLYVAVDKNIFKIKVNYPSLPAVKMKPNIAPISLLLGTINSGE